MRIYSSKLWRETEPFRDHGMAARNAFAPLGEFIQREIAHNLLMMVPSLVTMSAQFFIVRTLQMAGSLLMTLPVIAIFVFVQRFFLQGLTLTQ